MKRQQAPPRRCPEGDLMKMGVEVVAIDGGTGALDVDPWGIEEYPRYWYAGGPSD